MKARVEQHHPRHAKLLPLLDIEDDDGGMPEIQAWARPRWSSDSDEPGVSLGEWPTEYDD